MSTAAEGKHTPGALRAANLIVRSDKLRPLVLGGILRETAVEAFAQIIDRETAAPPINAKLAAKALGAVKSKRKAKSSAQNGKLGGRPRNKSLAQSSAGMRK